jgi:hypothetical protein
MFWLGLGIGLLVGGAVGLVMACLLLAARCTEEIENGILPRDEATKDVETWKTRAL